MNPVLADVSYKSRKELVSRERVRRVLKDWGDWEKLDLPDGVPKGDGWSKQVRHVCRNAVFSVLLRPVGGGVHLAVSSLSGLRPSWHEMQRIKNELLGESVTAVEIYPPQTDVVDGADMFHLWARPGTWLHAEWTIGGGS
jgi:hypothetical protein